MWRRIFILLIPVGLVCVVFWAVSAVPRYMCGIHQRSVTRELANWQTEYSSIESPQDAERTAEMLEYVQRYYVPGEGYHSTPEIEAELQNQRRDTVDSFVTSLSEYTGKDFGTDSEKWLTFLRSSRSEDDTIKED